jgi:hypothetical protein
MRPLYSSSLNKLCYLYTGYLIFALVTTSHAFPIEYSMQAISLVTRKRKKRTCCLFTARYTFRRIAVTTYRKSYSFFDVRIHREFQRDRIQAAKRFARRIVREMLRIVQLSLKEARKSYATEETSNHSVNACLSIATRERRESDERMDDRAKEPPSGNVRAIVRDWRASRCTRCW